MLYSTPLVIICFVWFSRLSAQTNSVVQQLETIVSKRLFVCACLITFGVIVYLIL